MSLSWSRIHLLAAREASRAHRDLNVDTTRQIDPFAALDRAGVLVLRRRLDHLAGLYLPPDPRDGRDVAAVLVNVAHPLSKQRFTAAHELGHHRRDHDVSLDNDTEWLTRGEAPTSERERMAEAFAAWFLMPKRLVVATLTALDRQATTLTADGAYALSLELGTSYAATVRHLADMGLLTTRRSEQLLHIAPQSIKKDLGGLDVATDTRRDVHLVHVARPETSIAVMEGDALVIEAPETPSSGYLWQVIPSAGLALVRDEYRSPDAALGGRGWHRFLFRAETTGQWGVALELRRPWQHDVAAAEVVRVTVMARPQPTPGLVQPELLVA